VKNAVAASVARGEGGDTHDCPVSDGDAFLAELVPAILDSATYRSGNLAVFIVWDEPTPMPLLVIAPGVKPGTIASTTYNHYSLLRSIDDIFGLPALGYAADVSGFGGDVFGAS